MSSHEFRRSSYENKPKEVMFSFKPEVAEDYYRKVIPSGALTVTGQSGDHPDQGRSVWETEGTQTVLTRNRRTADRAADQQGLLGLLGEARGIVEP